MPRVQPLSLEEVAAEAKDDYVHFTALFTDFENQVPVYAHSPAGLKHIFGMAAHHSAIAVDEGVDPEAINHILNPDPIGLTEAEKLVRDYAVLVTKRAWGIRDRVFRELRKHFSEAQIVELTMRIALTGMLNRINQALQIDMEDGVMPAFEARGLDVSALPNPT